MSNMPNDLVQIDLDTAMALYLAGYANIPIIVDNGYPGGWASMEPRHFEDLFDGIMFFASDSKRESLLNPPRTDVGHVKEEIYLEALLTPPKTDIGHVKEEIYLEAEKTPKTDADDPTEGEMDDILCGAVYDEDDDPDWVETEPETAEEIPDEDESESLKYVEAGKALAEGLKAGIAEASEVPTVSKATEEGDSMEDLKEKDYALAEIVSIEMGQVKPRKWNVREAVYLNEKAGISKNKLTTLYGIAYNTLTKRINEYKCK